jgi:hypothetical protein
MSAQRGVIMAGIGAIISTVIVGSIFFTLLYYVVAAAVKKGILDANFVLAIKMGIRDADKEREDERVAQERNPDDSHASDFRVTDALGKPNVPGSSNTSAE